jgi:cytochrome c
MEVRVNRLAILCAILVMAAEAQDKTARSVWDGVFSEAQAARGQSGYAKSCASCHGDKLQGRGQTPPLTGTDFLSNWNGMSVSDLFDQIQTTMPADHPGELNADQTADIVAYILKFNKFPAGPGELPSNNNALKQIRIETEKPR